MGAPVQQLLTGMPQQRPHLSVAKDERGRLVVLAGRAVVLFGPFEPADLGARNLAIVALTQMGFGVGEVAEAFELQLGRVSMLRTAFRRHGSAGVVKKSGRPGPLDADAAARARRLIEQQGWTQQQVAVEFGVTQPAISQALARHPKVPDPTTAQATPVAAQPILTDDATPDDATPGDATPGDEGGQGIEQDSQGRGVAPRVQAGVVACRYAGVMLAHAYLDRAGVGGLLTGLGGATWRRFDQAQVATCTVLALLLGVDSIEGVKTLIPTQAGPLVGAGASPQLDTLRPRLAAIADATDVPGLQTALATAMLAMPGQDTGLFYVDDHFVPYTGTRPVAMGHNGKRDRCEKGRADTLITDARGRAVTFTSAEPSHLSKTMKPALAQLRAIVPTGAILLGFDRGGAYAEAFTACHELDIDFVTYRRGKLAATTAEPVAHQVTRDRTTIEVVLAEEQIEFKDYHGPCRQLTLYERSAECTCTGAGIDDLTGCTHLTAVLQVLTSDQSASGPDLLFALKGRWVIENVFKYLDFYGIDWLVDYHADIQVNTKLVDNPARKEANAAIRAAKTARDDAHRALGALLTSTATAQEKNTAIPTAEQTLAAAVQAIKDATTARDTIAVKLPANIVHPDARRALQRTHRRGLLMALRLLAYNADTWLADHLNTYLQDPNEYRRLTRALMEHPGTITYTPDTITVTLDRHHAPRINRALAPLLDELNATPAHMPGDPRPITYHLAR
jgi:transposase